MPFFVMIGAGWGSEAFKLEIYEKISRFGRVLTSKPHCTLMYVDGIDVRDLDFYERARAACGEFSTGTFRCFGPKQRTMAEMYVSDCADPDGSKRIGQ